MGYILVVEDEKMIREIIIKNLRDNGHECLEAEDGIEALRLLKEYQEFKCIIIDVLMPYIDGFSVCKLVRETSQVPIIILSAKSSEQDKVMGYDIGVDDYITKPFSPRILVAKVEAILRRTTIHYQQQTIKAGKIVIVPSAATVYVTGHSVELTHKEYKLLELFMTNQEHVFTREQILKKIWGYEFEGNTRTVDTHIKTLRQKLGEEGKHIVTLIRTGYKFEVRL
ncbi:MAG: response regulator transcription factor [Cellulosilyticaceae bacterium]